ncbi:unnamed protein product [Prunus armeniaca]|uniref:Uncharacterized protein n=1 Tax=Prunus armeniaca TaxID=36596 RepID=A0A6J5U5P5_PRUAR|nr:unnamed protein product [Prunus armeniaca]
MLEPYLEPGRNLQDFQQQWELIHVCCPPSPPPTTVIVGCAFPVWPKCLGHAKSSFTFKRRLA